MNKFEKLAKIDNLIADQLKANSVMLILNLIGIENFDKDAICELKLYTDFLPMSEQDPYTEEQRYLHFL